MPKSKSPTRSPVVPVAPTAAKKPITKPGKYQPKTPVEILFMRRLAVREQKRQMIMQNLRHFPSPIFYAQSALLSAVALVVVSIQIVSIVKRTPLFFVCTGFWTAAFLVGCIVSLIKLERHRSYRNLIFSQILHAMSFLVCLGGLIALSIIEMAMFNEFCITACPVYSNQYLGLIMVIFGTIASVSCLAFLLIVDYLIVSEARALNIYLENRK